MAFPTSPEGRLTRSELFHELSKMRWEKDRTGSSSTRSRPRPPSIERGAGAPADAVSEKGKGWGISKNEPPSTKESPPGA